MKRCELCGEAHFVGPTSAEARERALDKALGIPEAECRRLEEEANRWAIELGAVYAALRELVEASGSLEWRNGRAGAGEPFSSAYDKARSLIDSTEESKGQSCRWCGGSGKPKPGSWSAAREKPCSRCSGSGVEPTEESK